MQEIGNKSYQPLSLSIRIYADGFSFFVCNPQSSSLVHGEHFHCSDSALLAQRLQQELSKPDYFNRQIEQAYVLLCAPSTHIPLEAFHRDEVGELYHLTFADSDMESLHVAYTIQPQLESVEVYAIPRDLEEIILQFYPTARFFASRAMLMERLARYCEDVCLDAVRHLFVVPEDKGLSIYAFVDGHLHYANTFFTDSTEDSVYFILNVWRVLEMQSMTDRCMLCVAEEQDAMTLKQALSEFILHTEIVNHRTLFPRVPLAREKQVPADLKALLLNRL